MRPRGAGGGTLPGRVLSGAMNGSTPSASISSTALAWTTEPVLEQVVRLQLCEHSCASGGDRLPVSCATARRVLSYTMLWGTPPRNENAETCPSQNASVVSAGYALTNMASLWGRSRMKKWLFRFTPPMTANASPKSHWACPGGCDERHEHLPCPATVLSDVVLDDRVPAVEAVLVPQLLVDALGGVALLPGQVKSLPRT